MTTKPERFERDSSGHVWLKPIGSGKAREFRVCFDRVQERFVSTQNVIDWHYIDEHLQQTTRGKALYATNTTLLQVLQLARKNEQSTQLGALRAAYLRASRGE